MKGKAFLLPFYRACLFRQNRQLLFYPFATFAGTIESSIVTMLGNRSVIFIERSGRVNPALIRDVMEKYENPPVDEKSLSADLLPAADVFRGRVYIPVTLIKDPLYAEICGSCGKEIKTNYGQELTVLDFKPSGFYHPQYLSRLFGRFLGCSAYEYLTVYRINKAKGIPPDLSANERTGYRTESGLYRCQPFHSQL